MIQQYKITLSESFGRVAPFFYAYPDAREQLCAKIDSEDKNFNFESLAVGDMLQLISGNIPAGQKKELEAMTVEAAAARLNAIKKGLEKFTAALQATTPPETIDSARLMRGTLTGSIEEAVLWTLCDSFALDGFEAAAKLTIYEFLAARKKIYNETIIANNRNNSSIGGSRRRL